MKLDEALSAARSAEAALDDGTILIEHMVIDEDDPEGLQLYWYDIRRRAMCQHSDWSGEYYTLRDLADELAEYDLVIEQLDWSPTSRAVEMSDCTCADCTAFCLANHIFPPRLPWYARTWYRVCWRLSDVVCWCRGCWWLVRYRWHSGCMAVRMLRVRLRLWFRQRFGPSFEKGGPLSEFDACGWDDLLDE